MNKTYIIDIDNTICDTPYINRVNRYDLSSPRIKNIIKINSLYNKGNYIIYWTSRGNSTGIDWLQYTNNQLLSWGCLFHKLNMNKPNYDIWVDDKSINDKDFFNE